MDERIVGADQEAIADFIINDASPPDVVPMRCVLSGSRAYGLGVEGSDRDYLSIHLMDSHYCFEHPDFRPKLQVIRKQFNADLEPIQLGEKSEVSLDSFELWKFISLYLKGSFISYELLYMPAVHSDPKSKYLFDLMKSGITNRIGKAARGNAMHDWLKNRNSRKKTVMAYYRLMQAIHFLREAEFEWDAEKLMEYTKPSGLVEQGRIIFNHYKNPNKRNTRIQDSTLENVSTEIRYLIDEVDKSAVSTVLPDQVPKKVLESILQITNKTRLALI